MRPLARPFPAVRVLQPRSRTCSPATAIPASARPPTNRTATPTSPNGAPATPPSSFVAAAHEQARFRPVLSVLIQQAIRSAYDRERGGRLERPCLVLLDEAGNI